MSYNKSKSFLPERGRFILFEIGLIITISAALVAFNYKVEKDDSDICTLPIPASGEIEEVIPSTIQKQEMPKPPAPPTIFNIRDDEVDIDTEIFIDVEDVQMEAVTQYEVEIPDEVEIEEPPIDFPDKRPQFPGGEAARLKFLYSQIQYPRMAVEAGIDGTVLLRFVVRKDGSIRDVQVLRGPGGGLEEEAIRVTQLMPRWEPGFKDGKPVHVRFVMPVKFVLQ